MHRGIGRRRGWAACWAVAALVVAVAAVAMSGCGGSSREPASESAKEADAGMLNSVLERELAMASAYARGLPLLKGEARAVALKFQAQDQEYVDAIKKALRGLGAEVDAEPEEVDFTGVDDETSMLVLAYELESATLAYDLGVEPHLTTLAPRSFVAGMAVGHGQHLVVLRQLLGARRVESVPEAFDGGNAPLPEAVTADAAGEAGNRGN